MGSSIWRAISRYVEPVMVLAIAVSLVVTARFLISAGYLPRPFFYNSVDDFMDWYNTSFYANNRGAYDVWGSVYPPISFLFLRIFSIHSCYAIDSVHARDCDVVGALTLGASYIIGVFLVWKAYSVSQVKNRVWRWGALCFGLPMLFAIDRGNLIIPCFTFFVLGHSRIIRSARLKWLCLAVTVNFKPYLILGAVWPGLRFRWRWVEGALIATVGVYFLSLILFGSGSLDVIAKNTLNFSNRTSLGSFDSAYYSSSVNPLIELIRSNLPLTEVVGSNLMEAIESICTILLAVSKIIVVIALAMIFLRPFSIRSFRVAALCTALPLTATEPGGYAEIFLIFLVFYERPDRILPFVAVICAYLLCIPKDITLYRIARDIQDSYLTNRTVAYDIGVSFGELVRPILVLVIQIALSVSTIIEIVRGVRADSQIVGSRKPLHPVGGQGQGFLPVFRAWRVGQGPPVAHEAR